MQRLFARTPLIPPLIDEIHDPVGMIWDALGHPWMRELGDSSGSVSHSQRLLPGDQRSTAATGEASVKHQVYGRNCSALIRVLSSNGSDDLRDRGIILELVGVNAVASVQVNVQTVSVEGEIAAAEGLAPALRTALGWLDVAAGVEIYLSGSLPRNSKPRRIRSPFSIEHRSSTR